MRTFLDVNCDMGESFGPWHISQMSDESLLNCISAANIATGFHAGDPNHMHRLVALARQYNVKIGAHPGYRDLQGFGRRKINATAEELVNDMIYQIGALKAFCDLHKTPLHHIKPHGALYMELAQNQTLAQRFLNTIHQLNPEIPIYCMSSSVVYQEALKIKHPVVREFFADRDYDDEGRIVFVRKMTAPRPEEIKEKLRLAFTENKVRTITNNVIPLPFDSVCFHSDTDGCARIARCISEVMRELNIQLNKTPIKP